MNTGAKPLGPSFVAIPGALSGSCMGHAVAGTWTGACAMPQCQPLMKYLYDSYFQNLSDNFIHSVILLLICNRFCFSFSLGSYQFLMWTFLNWILFILDVLFWNSGCYLNLLISLMVSWHCSSKGKQRCRLAAGSSRPHKEFQGAPFFGSGGP